MAPIASSLGPAKGKTALACSALLVIVALIFAACGGGGASNGTTATTHVLKAVGSLGNAFTENLSPFSPNVNPGVEGVIYENLVYVNYLTGQETPLIATSHSFNSDNTQLTFAIRQGITWSDGQPLTASDVVFTFMMLKQYPNADGAGIWTHITGVSATDPNTVVFTFGTPDVPLLPFIEETYIVPQHLWSTIGDPTKFINASPVGSGPMKLKSFTAQQITLVKNPSYWQASSVKVDELDELLANSNDTAILKIANHDIDWTAVFDTSTNTAFVAKDPAHNFVYNAAVVPVMLVPNLKNPLLAQLAVRQAISAALDRQQISTSGEAGQEAPASPTGLMPGQERYLPAADGGTLPVTPTANPTQADAYLTAAGFTKGADGIYADAQGNKLAFKVTVPGDYSDYVQDLQIAVQNLQAAGISMTLNEVSDDAFRTDRASHNFDLTLTGGFFGATPYYFFEPLLNSSHIAGANATNWEQWSDPTTDQLLAQYAASSDVTVQTQAISGLADIMAKQLPVITVTGAVQFFEYTTAHWTGWPTPQNPYAIGSAYPLPAGDAEIVLTHLTPAP